MSSENFFLEFKSTLDFLLTGILAEIRTQVPGPIHLVDLADISGNDDKLKGADPCILFELMALDPSPQHPLYTVSFVVGAKTGTTDLGGYTLSELVSKVSSKFEVQNSFQVKDYTQVTAPTDSAGNFVVMSRVVDPQQFDHQSAIRLSTVIAKAVAYG